MLSSLEVYAAQRYLDVAQGVYINPPHKTFYSIINPPQKVEAQLLRSL